MLTCMRTTLQLDDDLVVAAKTRAVQSGRTLSQVIEDALRRTLVSSGNEPRVSVRIPTTPGAPRPGVDLDDSAGLRDLMDDGS